MLQPNYLLQNECVSTTRGFFLKAAVGVSDVSSTRGFKKRHFPTGSKSAGQESLALHEILSTSRILSPSFSSDVWRRGVKPEGNKIGPPTVLTLTLACMDDLMPEETREQLLKHLPPTEGRTGCKFCSQC